MTIVNNTIIPDGTNEELREIKRKIKRKHLKEIRLFGKIPYYLGAISIKVKFTGHETEMDWKKTIGIGIKYHYQLTQITRLYHPIVFLVFLCSCLFAGLKAIWEAMSEFTFVNRSERKHTFVELYKHVKPTVSEAEIINNITLTSTYVNTQPNSKIGSPINDIGQIRVDTKNLIEYLKKQGVIVK